MGINVISAKVEDDVMEDLINGTKSLMLSLSNLILNEKFKNPENCGVACARIVFNMLRFLEKEFIKDEFQGRILVSFIGMFTVLLSDCGIDFHGAIATNKEKEKSEKLFIGKPSKE